MKCKKGRDAAYKLTVDFTILLWIIVLESGQKYLDIINISQMFNYCQIIGSK